MLVMYTPDDIRRLRFELKMTLAEFGRLVGASESTVCNWELGKRHPKYATLVKLNDIARKHRDAGPILV
jgi:DNA-binding transcriptional regulator YiaG